MYKSNSETIQRNKVWIQKLQENQAPLRKKPSRENILHSKGQIYRQNQQDAIKNQEIEEYFSHPFRPAINNSNLKREQSIEDRLIAAGKIYRQRQQLKIQQQQQQEEIDAMQPEKSPTRSNTHELLYNYSKFYKYRQEDRERLSRVEPERNSPKLSEGSKAIIKQTSRQGLIEDRLIMAGEYYKSRKQERVNSQEKKIVKRTVRGDVWERLYTDRERKQENMRLLEIKHEQQFSFSPKITPRKKVNRTVDQQHSLILTPKRTNSDRIFDTPIMKENLSVSTITQSPIQKNYKSSKNAEGLTRKLNELRPPIPDQKKTLPRSMSNSNNQSQESSIRRSQSNCKITKKHRWERLYEMHTQIRNKKNQVAPVKTDPECTFKPETNHSPRPTRELSQRLAEWAQERDSKRHFLQEQELSREMDACTFSPKLNKLKPSENNSVVQQKGVEKFLERVKSAKVSSKIQSNNDKLFTFGKSMLVQEFKRLQIVSANEFLKAVKNLHEELHS